MVEVVTEITIERPLKEVVEFAASPDNASKWYDTIKGVEWRTNPPLRIGSEIAFIASFLGEIAFTSKIIDLGDHHLEMEIEVEGDLMTTRYEWKEISKTCTKMTLRNISYPKGLSKILSPVKSLMLKRSNMQDLERLKRIVENGLYPLG